MARGPQQGSGMTPAQQNALARQLITMNAIEVDQQIFTSAINPASNALVNVAPRNVGLIKGFLVTVAGTFNNGGGSAATRTPLGAANLVSRFTFNDLQNNVRINTPGWHIAMLDSAKSGGVYGGAYAPNIPVGFGNNWAVQSAPNSIAAGADANVQFVYYVPLCYAADDFRGGVYAGVVNATMNLGIQLNTQVGVAAGSASQAVYSGAGSDVVWKAGTTVQVSVQQLYWDQIPVGGQGPVLPLLDLSTIYDLKDTTNNGIVGNQDFAIPYPNFRTFLSTWALFDNGGQLNTGSDVAYWAIQAANYQNIFKRSPTLMALMARNVMMADPPAGMYYFDMRRKPVSTLQYGNMALVLNAQAVQAGAYVQTATEAFATLNTISQAGSLPAS